MPDFLDKKFEDQIKRAIDYGDPKLLQIVLGPRYLQLWHYWQAHTIISRNILIMHKATQYQLPLKIISEQKKILDKQELLLNRQLIKIDLLEIQKKLQAEKDDKKVGELETETLSLRDQKY